MERLNDEEGGDDVLHFTIILGQSARVQESYLRWVCDGEPEKERSSTSRDDPSGFFEGVKVQLRQKSFAAAAVADAAAVCVCRVSCFHVYSWR